MICTPCSLDELTHWGRMTHICVSRLTITGSDNGLSPGRRQAIIWTNAGILLIGPLWTNFSENLIEILTFSYTKMRLKVSSAKWRPFGLGLDELSQVTTIHLKIGHPYLWLDNLQTSYRGVTTRQSSRMIAVPAMTAERHALRHFCQSTLRWCPTKISPYKYKIS